MPTQTQTFPVQFQGGLISNVPPLELGIQLPGAASKLKNFEPSIQGGYRRINGFTKWDSAIVPTVSSSSQILGVAFFDGDVIAVREGKIHTSSGSGWTQIATGRTHTTKHRFHQFNFDGTRKIVGTDGVNYPYTWDGTNFVNINGTTDVLATSHAAAFADAMFYAAGDLVSFTVPFDETDFTGGSGAGNFRVSGDVTGMIVFRNQLIIFTEEKIFVLTGTSSSDFQLDSVSTNIGCVEPDSIQEVNGDIAFLAADGMRMLGATANNNDWSNQTISKNIQQEFNQFRTDFTDFSSTTVRDKSQYRIFGWHTSKLAPASVSYIAAQTLPDQKAFEWSQCDGIKVYSIDSKVYNGDEYIVFCSDTEYVYRLEDGSDYDGTDITSSLWTPYMSFNDPFFRKTLYKMYLYTTPEDSFTGTLNVKYDISDKMRPQPTTIAMDASGGGAKYGTAVYGSSVYFTPSTSIIKAPLVGSGQNASFQFEFNGSEPFTIDTLLIEYATEDRR